MPERWDVIVAGGGTAGLAAARSASKEGGKVLLLELRAHLGPPAHSGSLVSSDAGILVKRAVAQRLREIKLHAPHRELTVDYDRGMIVDLGRIDEILAAEVAENGGEIWLNAPVKSLLMEDGVVRGVHIEAGGWSENIRGEVVVDATGARGDMSCLFLSEVLRKGWKREFLAFYNEYLMVNASDEKSAEVFFDSYLAPGGHAWVYPLTKGLAVSGICGLRIHPDAALDEFLGRREIKRLTRAVPIAASRGQLPLEGPLSLTCGDGILAAGGAAGQIFPLSGQGLQYSLRCGEIAGRVAVDAITEGDVSKERLSEYDRVWRSEFGRDFEIGKVIYSSLSVSRDQKMDALAAVLDGRPGLQRAFVDLFLGFNLASSARTLLKDEEISKIFGGEVIKLFNRR